MAADNISPQRLLDLASTYSVLPGKLLDGAVMRALSGNDLDSIGQVIDFIEEMTDRFHTPLITKTETRNSVGQLPARDCRALGFWKQIRPKPLPGP